MKRLNVGSKEKENVVLIIILIIGLFSFYLYVSSQQYPRTSIHEITPDMIGEKVVVCGKVEDIYNKKSVRFYTISEGDHILLVVSFPNSKMDKEVFKDDIICVRGEIKMYKGKLELISREISHELIN